MGYSIYHGSTDLNVTYNVSDLLSHAFGCENFATFINGQNGLYLIPYIERAIHRLKKNPEYFKQFEASNGWGTVEQMIPYLERFLDSCKCDLEENVLVF